MLNFLAAFGGDVNHNSQRLLLLIGSPKTAYHQPIFALEHGTLCYEWVLDI